MWSTICHFLKRGSFVDVWTNWHVAFTCCWIPTSGRATENTLCLGQRAQATDTMSGMWDCWYPGVGEKGWKRYGKGEVSAKWESWCVELVVRGDELYVTCYFSFIHTYALLKSTHFWNLLNTFDYVWLVQRHLRLFWNWTSRCRWTMVDYDDFVQYLLRWCEMWNLWFKRILSHQRLPQRFCNGFPRGQWKLRQVCGDHIQKQVQEWSVATEKKDFDCCYEAKILFFQSFWYLFGNWFMMNVRSLCLNPTFLAGLITILQIVGHRVFII